jgi:hypothetical protein
MQFGALVTEVKNYVRVQGADNEELIKDFINESILDFIKLDEWKHTRQIETITLDGSGSYSLAAFTSGQFWGEIELVKADNGSKYDKYDYKEWIRATDKNNLYSIFGGNLYVEGDGFDLSFLYIDQGSPYPLVAEADEIPVTIYYWDIIKKMTVIYFLDYINEDEAVRKEEEKLQYKLTVTARNENRIRKNGQLKIIRRGFQGKV